MRRAICGLLAVVLLGALAAGPAGGQGITFGKNKIRYSDFQWRILKSDHFDLYYYPQEESLAVLALETAEASYRDLAVRFAWPVRRRIPLIIYASHQDFEQTNLTPTFLPEGVAGFTEFLKGRVAIPFNGSISDFRHTIHHELVHVHQLASQESLYGRHYRVQPLDTPMWMSEGMSDLWSEEWDGIAEMVLRDLVLSNQLPAIDDLWRFYGTFTIYKVGQDLCGFIERQYGPDAIPRIYQNLWKAGTFDEVLSMTFGVSEKELSERWHRDLKLRYYPAIAAAGTPQLDSDPVATRGGMSFKPCPIPAEAGLGDNRFLYLSPRTGYTTIYLADRHGPEGEGQALIEGDRRADYESLHPFRSRLDVTPAGRLAFVAKYHERDALYLYDLKSRSMLGRWQFEDLVGLLSPSQSRDGRVVAFSGLGLDGRSDLYIFYLDDGRLERLTGDWYQDLDPAISPDGRFIAFASDRGPEGERGHRGIYLFDRQTGSIRALTDGRSVDGSPAWSRRGDRLAFVSDRSGTPQIHVRERDGTITRVTSLQGGAFDPAWLDGDQQILYTAYHQQRYGIFRLRALTPRDEPVTEVGPLAADAARPEPAAVDTTRRPASWSPAWRLDSLRVEQATYRRHYSFDLAQAMVGLDPSLGSGEGLSGSLSDQMSDRLFYFQFSNSAQETGDLLTRTNLAVNYFDLSKRFRTGVGAYHFAGDFRDEADIPYFERRAGVDLIGSYAFSKFDRIDAAVFFFYSEKSDDSFRPAREAFLASNYVSLVRDNALWVGTGPIAGTRWNLTAGVTTDLGHASIENTALLADWRHYFRLGLRSAYAVRLQGRVSDGTAPQRFVLGGSYSLRGYPRRSLFGTRSFLVNQELRFPLLDGAALGFPIGTIGLPGVQGAFFADVGNAWEQNEGDLPRPRGSFGLGLRSSLGGFIVLRLDVARQTDFKKIDHDTRYTFFIGANY